MSTGEGAPYPWRSLLCMVPGNDEDRRHNMLRDNRMERDDCRKAPGGRPRVSVSVPGNGKG